MFDINTKKTSDLGNFSLEYDEKLFEFLESFTDFDSHLLIVRFADNRTEDKSFGTRSRSMKTLVIDPKIPKILSPENYQSYFSYALQEIIFENNLLKIKRIHDEKAETDFWKEELFDENGNLISSSSSLAFSSKKHRNLAERKAEERQKEVEKKAKEEAKCTAKELSTKTEKNIIDGDIVFAWKENDRQFFLHFEGKNFVLNEKNSNEKLLNKRYFETFELFWEFFSENKTWFLQRFFLPLPEPEKRFLAVFYVISSLREAKKMLILPSKEAYALYSWEQHFQSEELKKTEFVQFCPECKAEVFYFPRYPNYLCSACTALLTDKKGKKVAFYNEGMYGGCIGFYLDNEGNTSNKYEKDSAFIGEKEFYAQEGRFGGIVIQPVFKNDTPVFRR